MKRNLLIAVALLAGMVASFLALRSAPSSAQTTIPIGVDAYSNHVPGEPSGLTYVYKYIVPGGASLVPAYISTAYANGKKPVLVLYTNYDSTSPDWATWDAAMSAIAQDGRSVDVVVEPDLFGYIRNSNACGTTGKQVVDRFLSTAPSNARLGFFMSPWNLPYAGAASDAASWKSCWQAAGGDRMPAIYVDVSDRDQEYKGTYPWSASQIQMYEDWFKALSQATGRKVGVWQIPLGNSQCLNGRRSTFVENWLVQSKLDELSPYVDKLLFGPGIEDYDSANTQSWNLPQHIKYDCGMFNSRVNSLSNGVSPTTVPTIAPTATRTAVPTATKTAVPTATRTAVPTATRTSAPTATRTPSPTSTGIPPTVAPTATNTPRPTSDPPSVTPTATKTAVPTATRTAAPTATKTRTPTAVPPTIAPTATNTAMPTATRTAVPTATKTPSPTAISPTITPTPTNGSGLKFEAEWMSLPYRRGHGYVSSTASGGRALLIWSNASASRTVTLSAPASRVVVRAKGDQCNGSPHMAVSVDGVRIMSTYVTSTQWAGYSVATSLAAGSHVVKVTFDNDYYAECDRNLRLDSVTLSN